MVIVTIETQISTTKPDKNGRIFSKEHMDIVFRQRGYLRPNPIDRITMTPIPVRFFRDVNDYCSVLSRHDWNVDRHVIDSENFTVNTDIGDKELNALQIMFLNDRYYLNIPIKKDTYIKHEKYLLSCQAHAICLSLEKVSGDIMGASDILYFDIFPDE